MIVSKKLTVIEDKVLSRIAKKLCSLFGHRWLYKDYANYIQADGSKYDFQASRNCTRCNEHAYYYSAWRVETKSNIDFQSDYFSIPKIEINKVVYS
jgi:hypothetical protein